MSDCVRCESGTPVYCGPCVDKLRAAADALDITVTQTRKALDAAACPDEEGTVPDHRVIPLPERVRRLAAERDALAHELDFIKDEYGGADEESLTRDALLLKLRVLTQELDSERASYRQYARAHEDILDALKAAGADSYHPEDGEPVALWGVRKLVEQRDTARKYASDLGAWHPHSAVGYLRLIKAREQLQEALWVLAVSIAELRGETCGDCGREWGACADAGCENGDWLRTGLKLLKDTRWSPEDAP